MVKAELPNQAEGVGALVVLVEMGENGSALLELTSSVRNLTSQEKCDLCFLVMVW